MMAPRTRTGRPKEPGRDKTTITLPPALKKRAKLHALKTGTDLGRLIADGLRLVLARAGGK
jgi:hypothetical protein